MRPHRALVLAPALCAALASPLAAQDSAKPWSDLAANRTACCCTSTAAATC
ncbi:MAG: hypothetical protein JO143_04560 [Acetobacteraceae bacterium]|nr:hypothetical protein [Acetobacteraceae bacterium]